MSLITEAHRFELRRAGFTDRQINTMAQKFYNLRNISPFTTEEYLVLTKSAEIARQRDALLAALEPFTALLQEHNKHGKDDQPVFGINSAIITLGHLRNAIATIDKVKP